MTDDVASRDKVVDAVMDRDVDVDVGRDVDAVMDRDVVVDGRRHDWVVDSGARPFFACTVAPVPGD